MTLAIPPSRGLFGTVRSAARWTVDTATLVIVLPIRIANLLSAVELLLTRISQVVDAAAQIVGDAAATVDRVSHVVDGAETTVHRVDAVTDRAGGHRELGGDHVGPSPTAARRLPADRVTAAADGRSTRRVGPDVDALLNVFRDVREGLVGIPGFKSFRKRGEQMIAPEHQPDHPA